MRIKITFLNIIRFLLLTIIMLELHEMVHITTGRIICGAWGSRDFNVWQLCEDCNKAHPLYWLATLAGPVFSFVMMWVGKVMLSQANDRRKTIGFALIFANIPFGRISQAMQGAGDEMMVTKHLANTMIGHAGQILICSAVLLVAGLPPIISAYRAINNKRKWIFIIGFLTLPLAFILLYILIGMNGLLHAGFLSHIGIMGTPILISIHTIAAILLLLILRKRSHQVY